MPVSLPKPSADEPRDLIALLRAAEAGSLALLPHPPLVLRIRAGSPVYLEGARMTSIHVVRTGSVKCVRLREDGYEQVVSFAERGDVLGFDGLCRGTHVATAIALEDTTVYVLPLIILDALPAQAGGLAHALRLAVSRELLDAARIADIMAAVSAETRLARFLLWWSERAALRGESMRRLRLRMCRRDVASLMGVAHETVSRSFTELAREGVLQVDNREIEILDREALQVLASATRRHLDSGSRLAQDAAGA